MSGYTTNTPTQTEVLQQALDALLSDVHTCMPGTVVAFDPTTQLATVKCGFLRKYASEDAPTPHPLLVSVLVLFPATATAWLRFPIAPGDTVLLVFSERALDNWWLTGAAADPELPRKFSVADAIALPGLRSRAATIVPRGGLASVELVNGLGMVEIQPGGTFKVSNGTVELMHQLVALLDQLTGTGIFLNPALGTVTFTPTVLVQLNLIKAALTSLEGV